MTDRELKRLLAEWQKTLRLQDWTVTAKIVRSKNNMGDLPALGLTESQITVKCAHISVLHPEDYKDHISPYDAEQTLVHELMHLHFAPFAPNDWATPQGVAMEQAIDLIACALVTAKRMIPPKCQNHKPTPRKKTQPNLR